MAASTGNSAGVAVMPSAMSFVGLEGGVYDIELEEREKKKYQAILEDGIKRLSEAGYEARGDVVMGEAIDEITRANATRLHGFNRFTVPALQKKMIRMARAMDKITMLAQQTIELATRGIRFAAGSVLVFAPDSVHPHVETGHELYLQAIVRSLEPIKAAIADENQLFSAMLGAPGLRAACSGR